MQEIRTIDRYFYRQRGEEIRKIRNHRNMTLKEVSQETGYSRALIDCWELGRCKINPKQLEKLCQALDVTNNLKVEVRLGFLLDE